MEIFDSTTLKNLLAVSGDVVALVLLGAGTYFLTSIKGWILARKAKKFDLSINRNTKQIALLTELRALCQSDRVAVFQIHNGEYFLSGESNMKCSLTHFAVRSGVAVPEGNLQNIQTTHLTELFKEMKSGHTEHWVPYDETIDPTFRQLMSVNGSRYFFAAPLKRKNEVWLGFLVLEWVVRENEEEPIDTKLVKEYAQKIADNLQIK